MPQLTITTVKGQTLVLTPVPMKRMPSSSPVDWNKFLGKHLPETMLSDQTCVQVNAFLIEHQTDALTDGTKHYTLDGEMLAECDPSQIQ